MVNSDKHWAELGRQDPYLGTVKTLDPYKLDPTLTQDMDGYFESGNRYLTDLWAAIRQHVTPDFNPRLAVDFGCLSLPPKLDRRLRGISRLVGWRAVQHRREVLGRS